MNENISKYIEGYFKSEEEASLLYYDVLNQLERSIIEGNIEHFNRVTYFLDVITAKEPQSFVSKCFQNVKNPLRRTNLIIICCKYGRDEILESVLNNNSNILRNLTVKISKGVIESTELDEERHSAVYYALRSSNIRILEMLFQKWPHEYYINPSNEIESILSGCYKELKLRSVEISFKTEQWVQKKLLSVRLYDNTTKSEQSNDQLLTDINKRIDILFEAYDQLEKFKTDKDIFIYIIKFSSKIIHVLKRLLKSTYYLLPWEEIEFCLVSYIWAYTKCEEICLLYRLSLTRNKIMNHLKNFIVKLGEISRSLDVTNVKSLSVLPDLSRQDIRKSIIEFYPPFSDLYDDFEPIRNIRSLEILKGYVERGSEADVNDVAGRLTVTRCFQIIGEHLKNSLESPKLSEYLIDKIISPQAVTRSIFSSFLSKDARKIIIDVRNRLNHCNKFLDNQSVHFFSELQQDIKKLAAVFSYNLYEEKIKLMQVLCVQAKTLAYGEFEWEQSFQMLQIEEFNSLYMEEENIIQINDIISEFEGTLSHCYNECIALLFRSLKQFLELEKNRLKKITNSYRKCFNQFKQYFYRASNEKLIEDRDYIDMIGILTENSRGTLNNYDIMLKLSAKLVTAVRSSIHDSDRFDEHSYNFISRMYTTIVFKVNDLHKTKVLWDQIMIHDKTKKKNKKNTKKDLKSNTEKMNATPQITKLEHLQTLLSNLICSNSQSLTTDVNKEDLASIEAPLLDLISILKDSLKRVTENMFFLEDEVPILNGNSLRQHLAHINDIFETLDCDLGITTVLNAHNLTEEEISKSDFYIGKSVENCPSRLLKMFKNHLGILINQIGILKAVKQDNISLLSELMTHGGDLNSKIGLTKRNLLHVAASSNSQIIFQYLLDRQISVLWKDTCGMSVLHCAVSAGAGDIVKLCLKHGCDVDTTDNAGKSPLHLAAETGSVNIVNELLANKAEINMVCNLGLTPIIYALRNNRMEVIERLLEFSAKISVEEASRELCVCIENNDASQLDLLIKFGADVNAISGEYGITPLIVAVKMGRLNIIERLLTLDVNVENGNIYGITPLHMAIAENQEDIALFILKYVTDVTTPSCVGITPLHIASKVGNERILKELIEKGATVNVVTKHELSPLHIACYEGHHETVKLLLDRGADVNCQCSYLFAVTQFINFLYDDISTRNVQGDIADYDADKSSRGIEPIFLAAERGHVKIIDTLLNYGCDIDHKDCFGKTLLFYGIIYNHTDMITWLIDKNIKLNEKTSDGRSVMHYATFFGNEDTVNQLLMQGCDVNDKDINSLTPLHFAVSARNKEMVSYLIDKKADIESKSNKGLTPLMVAVERSSVEIIEMLLEAGAGLNVCDVNGHSLVAHAISKNRRDVLNILLKKKSPVNSGNKEELQQAIMMTDSFTFVEILLRYKADLNIKDKSGWAVLHWAAYLNKLDVLSLLISKGADIEIENNNGNKAIHLGAQMGHTDIVLALLSAGSRVDSTNHNNATPLHLAASYGNKGTIEALIERGSDVSRRCTKGYTPLHLAVINSNSKVIHSLVTNLNINMADEEGRTPLFIACVKGFTDIARILMENGAVVDAPQVYAKERINVVSPLLSSIELGLKDVVKLLLENRALINLSNESKFTAIWKAINKGHKYIVEMLCDFGLDVNIRDRNQNIPLHFACFHGKEEMVSSLTERGAAVNAQNLKGETPLHAAIDQKKVSIIEYLLKRGADANIANKEKFTPFSLAILKNYIDMVKIMLSYKKWISNDGFHIAACKGYTAMILLLLDNGYNVNEKYEEVGQIYLRTPLHYAVIGKQEETVRLLISKGADVNCTDKEETTPLHIAAQDGQTDIIQHLITSGANINSRTDSGETPLHYASFNGHVAAVQVLLANNAEVDSRDNLRITPLIRSAKLGHFEVARLLLNANADLELSDNVMKRPIHIACLSGDTKLLELLIERGAEIDPVDIKGVAPLRYACQAGNIESAKILINRKSDVDKKCNSGLTALHYASYLGKVKIVELLVASKADVNCKDNEGNSPLHMAVQNGHERVIDILLENQADVNITDLDNVTPLQIAMKNGHENIVQTLIKRGAIKIIV